MTSNFYRIIVFVVWFALGISILVSKKQVDKVTYGCTWIVMIIELLFHIIQSWR